MVTAEELQHQIETKFAEIAMLISKLAIVADVEGYKQACKQERERSEDAIHRS